MPSKTSSNRMRRTINQSAVECYYIIIGLQRRHEMMMANDPRWGWGRPQTSFHHPFFSTIRCTWHLSISSVEQERKEKFLPRRGKLAGHQSTSPPPHLLPHYIGWLFFLAFFFFFLIFLPFDLSLWGLGCCQPPLWFMASKERIKSETIDPTASTFRKDGTDDDAAGRDLFIF